MIKKRAEHIDPSKSKVMALFKRFVPSTDEYHGQKFWIKQGGKWVATPLLAVLVLVETTDIIFAVDSIPAIFAVTQEPFLVFTANAFAILGLRAMYFLLADLMHRFVYLKLGLGLVLIWVGIKLVLQVDVYKMPTWLSLGVVAVIIATSIAASLIVTRRGDTTPEMDSVAHGDGRPVDDRGSEAVDVSDQSRTRAGLRTPES